MYSLSKAASKSTSYCYLLGGGSVVVVVSIFSVVVVSTAVVGVVSTTTVVVAHLTRIYLDDSNENSSTLLSNTS